MEQVCFNCMAAVTVCSECEVQENKDTVSIFSPSICHEVIAVCFLISLHELHLQIRAFYTLNWQKPHSEIKVSPSFL